VAGALTLAAGGVLPANAATSVRADYAPNGNASFGDVVGVGSDTLEFILDFGADGDVSGDSGYNDAGNLYKLISFDATADANARASWANGSTLSNPLSLNPTTVYRGGTYPIQRINGSGAGINALLTDTAPTDPYLNFVRMSSNPTAANGATAQSNGWQGLQDFVLGHEDLAAAAANSTNAPAGLTTTQLASIYTCADTTWASVGVTGANSGDKIIPIIPTSGSGTRKTFESDIGITDAQLGPCVVIAEESDPTAITSLSSTTTDPNGGTCTPNCSYDAIEPISGARLNLWSGKSGNTTFGSDPGTGYFHDPTANYPGGAALSPGIHQLLGSPPGGGTTYDDNRALNVVYRWTDQLLSTPWQPGGTLNWAETLFCNPGGTTTPFFQTAAGKTLIAEAGANPASQSCLSTPLT
jgi:ABC-type phosphate transport system substrate-binding protein